MIYLFKLFFEEEKRRRVILNLFVVCLMLSISSIVFAGGLTFSGQVKDKAGTLIGAGKAVDLKSTADNSVKTSTVTDASSYILNSLGWFWGESNYSVKVYVDNGDYYGHSRTLYLGDTTAKPGDAPVNINTSFKKAVPPTPILDSAYVAVEKVLNEIPTSNEAPVIKFHVNAKSGSGYKVENITYVAKIWPQTMSEPGDSDTFYVQNSSQSVADQDTPPEASIVEPGASFVFQNDAAHPNALQEGSIVYNVKLGAKNEYSSGSSINWNTKIWQYVFGGTGGVNAVSFSHTLFGPRTDKLVVNLIAAPVAMEANVLESKINAKAGSAVVVAISHSLPKDGSYQVYIPGNNNHNSFPIYAGEGVQVYLTQPVTIELGQ